MPKLNRGPRKGDPIKIKDGRFRGSVRGNACFSVLVANGYPHLATMEQVKNSPRECQRRVKQIRNGALRVANGVTQEAWDATHGAVS
jgi:hypothetical protein